MIIIDISGSLPIIGNFPDTFEVVDDGQEQVAGTTATVEGDNKKPMQEVIQVTF